MEDIAEVKLKLRKYFTNNIDRSEYQPVKIFHEKGSYYLILKSNHPPYKFHSARSLDGFDFDLSEKSEKFASFNPDKISSAVVNDFYLKKKKLIYLGDRHIYLATSEKDSQWKIGKKNLIDSPYPNEVGGAYLFPKGIVLLYFDKLINNNQTSYQAHIAEFDKDKPDQLLWKTEKPIWNSQDHWLGKKVAFLGSALLKNKLIMYWYVDESVIYGVYLTSFLFDPKHLKTNLKLSKHKNNPIISPRQENSWEAFTTLNPAAVKIDNKVHILYRAQGYDYISKFGYAVSSDGVRIDSRLTYPVYEPSAKFETNNSKQVNLTLTSAGGYGGCEDPRVTLMDGRVYMVYVAFDGWENLRLALTSIDVYDFLNQRWNWEKPVLISPPHVIDKSGCLLPEKINGKYVFFHRVFPDILIDFVDDLNFSGDKKWLKGQYRIKVRPKLWDSRKIGAGAPPLKTKDGWLLIYYGVDDHDASKYHIGAMLLDINDPTKVLYRSKKPILSPTEKYENSGFKPGIAYPCGAVIFNNNLFVYYGAADSTVCVAKADLNDFLNKLKKNRLPHLSPVVIKEVIY